MKRNLLNYLSAALVLCVVGFVVNACGSSNSIAGSTLTTADVQSMIDAAVAPLKARLDADDAKFSSMIVQVKTSSTVVRSTQSIGVQPLGSVSAGGTVIGTRAGYIALDSSQNVIPATADSAIGEQVLTSSNYLANYTFDGILLPHYPLYYVSTDCTGTPYVPIISTTSGLAFRDQMGNDADTTTYWAITPANAQTIIDALSKRDSNGCAQVNTPGISLLMAQPNDSAVTGAQSAQIGTVQDSSP